MLWASPSKMRTSARRDERLGREASKGSQVLMVPRKSPLNICCWARLTCCSRSRGRASPFWRCIDRFDFFAMYLSLVDPGCRDPSHPFSGQLVALSYHRWLDLAAVLFFTRFLSCMTLKLDV